MEKSRKLVFDTTQTGVRFLLLRGADVPTYVQFGAADMGVSGKDTLMENGADGLDTLLIKAKNLFSEDL